MIISALPLAPPPPSLRPSYPLSISDPPSTPDSPPLRPPSSPAPLTPSPTPIQSNLTSKLPPPSPPPILRPSISSGYFVGRTTALLVALVLIINARKLVSKFVNNVVVGGISALCMAALNECFDCIQLILDIAQALRIIALQCLTDMYMPVWLAILSFAVSGFTFASKHLTEEDKKV
ncbi:CASP-like protein 4A1 [Papaver somniferum]|uniref:CASP-like protein 4A1 n=1 Tax=Papaver somniferum TaxID=3469 RepID=UPI000E6FC793|nr:CASP-like protein 4A1 [Papaver somniferum]